MWAKFKFGTKTDDIIDPVEVGCNPTQSQKFLTLKLNKKKDYCCSLGQKMKGSAKQYKSAHIQ